MKHTHFLASLKALKSKFSKKTTLNTAQMQSQTPDTVCTCTDSTGESKYLYSSQKELEYLLANKEVKLHAYPCPYEKGWHLTKG